MLGAIIGDIAGSRFGFNNHRDKEFELFHRNCAPTDDSIMAVASAIIGAGTEDMSQRRILRAKPIPRQV
jgi:hypothetical protein